MSILENVSELDILYDLCGLFFSFFLFTLTCSNESLNEISVLSLELKLSICHSLFLVFFWIIAIGEGGTFLEIRTGDKGERGRNLTTEVNPSVICYSLLNLHEINLPQRRQIMKIKNSVVLSTYSHTNIQTCRWIFKIFFVNISKIIIFNH